MPWRFALVAASALMTALLSAAPAAATDSVVVEVRNNEFAPTAVEVDPGGSVVWTLREGSHTITASDGAFRFTGMSLNDQRAYTFEEPGTFTYFCEFHGAAEGYPNGMTGVVYVGVDPPLEPTPETRTVPSGAFPTVQSALDDLPPDSTVLVRPGVYSLDEELKIESRGVTVMPSSKGSVTFEKVAGASANVGVVVAADDVVLRNMEVHGFDKIGVVIDGRRALLEDIRVVGAEGDADHGIRVLPYGSADVNRPWVSATDVAGVSVSGCRPPDVTSPCAYVTGGSVTGTGSGVLVDASEHVTIVGTKLDVRDGVGVDVRRSSRTLVAENRVVGASTGIAVTGPSSSVRVEGNRVEARLGLRWDGAGVDVCFRRNVDGAGEDATSDPATLQSLPCASDLREPG